MLSWSLSTCHFYISQDSPSLSDRGEGNSLDNVYAVGMCDVPFKATRLERKCGEKDL